MHREISHIDEVFHPRENYGLYLLTGLMGLLIFLEIWPWFVDVSGFTSLPTWPTVIYGWQISLIAAVIGGARILYTSLESLFEGRLGADLALAIAALAAILIGEPFVAAEVIFIGLVGECLESITFEKTQRAIRKIVEVFPRRCWLLKDGEEIRVRTTELQTGDVVVVKPGARIPVDGIIEEGRSAVDISALTGESIPVDKGLGDTVFAGSVNQFGALTIKSTKVGDQTVAGQVIEATAQALKDKAGIERTADRMAKYFLPLVLGLAAITFLGALFYYGSGWFGKAQAGALRKSVYPTLAVLVVACPCALILATPAAIIAALGRLAGTGVLIKGGVSLERLAGVSAFAFDKTGTLTEGRLVLGDITSLADGLEDNEVLRIAASAELRSEHLIAQLITQEANNRHLNLDPIEEFQAYPGAGVSVQTPAGKVLVGNRRLLEEQGIPLSEQCSSLLEDFDSKGQTALLVAREGEILGIIGARDQVREEAKGIIADLRELGIADIALLTGDRAAVAKSIGEEIGIEEIHSEILPEQKAEIVLQMRKRVEESAPPQKDWFEQISPSATGRVAMVGDGINDAPALASADVGLAIGGTGTDVAAEAGDVVFMGDPLKPLPLLVRLSRETVRIIRQNILIFAFAVNFIGILLTAWLWPFITPVDWENKAPLAAVLYHQFGSLAVLLNSMRLLWFERAKSSPAMEKAKSYLKDLDSFAEKYLDIGEGIHFLEHFWKPVLVGILLLFIAGWGISGTTWIGPDEIGVVQRFGRPIADLGPGMHYRWPWPIESVARIKPGQIRSVDIGFRSAPGAGTSSQTMSWVSAHSEQGLRRVPDESMMITGDGNLVDLQATIRYRVVEPRVYLFETSDPEETIRGATEAVLRSLVAKKAFADLLTADRKSFQDEVFTRVKTQIADYGLGIHVDSLSLHDLHPPQEVVASYYEVTRAMEIRDMVINNAEAESIRTRSTAKSKKQKIIREAQAAKKETITQAEAYRTSFLTFSKGRKELDLVQEWELFAECLNQVLDDSPDGDEFDYQKEREQKLAMQRNLIDFRLFWDALTTALTNRDLVLIDSNKVSGRRHLLLMEPGQMGSISPVLQRRGQPNRTRPTNEHGEEP